MLSFLFIIQVSFQFVCHLVEVRPQGESPSSVDSFPSPSSSNQTLASTSSTTGAPGSEASSNERITVLSVAKTGTNPWIQQAEDWGQRYLDATYQIWVESYSVAAQAISLANQPGLCTQVSKSVVYTCKKGVQAQVASYKQATKDAIAKCKDDVKKKVDRCKKSRPFNLGSCELMRAEAAKCEANRINVPGCEANRLSMLCCEGFRTSAQGLCTAGVTTARIQKQVQDIQSKCSLAIQVGVAAAKSYLSGQMVGFISQMSAIKEIGEGVNLINGVNSKRAQFERWADGLVAIAEGRLQDAQRQLSDLGVKLAPGAAGYIQAIQAAASKNIDAFVGGAANVAGEIELINEARKTVTVLTTIKNMQALQAEARRCSKVPSTAMRAKFKAFKSVRSEAEAREALVAYQKAVDSAIRTAAKCASVVKRIGRLPLVKG